jgi:hypothetical protein
VKKFPEIYKTRNVTAVSSKADHLFLSCARLIHPLPQSTYLGNPFYYYPPNYARVFEVRFLPPIPSSPVRTSTFPHACRMPDLSHSSWFDHPNYIWWGVHGIQLLVHFKPKVHLSFCPNWTSNQSRQTDRQHHLMRSFFSNHSLFAD